VLNIDLNWNIVILSLVTAISFANLIVDSSIQKIHDNSLILAIVTFLFLPLTNKLPASYLSTVVPIWLITNKFWQNYAPKALPSVVFLAMLALHTFLYF
jgi:hypothetical protein